MNIKETINKLLPEDIKVKLKEHLAKFSEMPVAVEPIAPVVEAPVKMATEVKLNDGTSLSVDGEVAIGSAVMLISPEGEMPAMDGEYVAEDGTTYSVLNGLIAEIASKEEEATEVKPISEMPTMMAEIESLKTQLAELKETIKLTLSAVNTIVEAPVVEPIEAKVEFANMTAFQRYKASK